MVLRKFSTVPAAWWDTDDAKRLVERLRDLARKVDAKTLLDVDAALALIQLSA